MRMRRILRRTEWCCSRFNFYLQKFFMKSLKNREFSRVYKEGKSLANHQIVLYVLENGLPENKLGITVSKKIGNSVVRHRVKRIIHEAYRLHENEFKPGWDIVVIARKPAITIKSTDMEVSLCRLGKKAGIL